MLFVEEEFPMFVANKVIVTVMIIIIKVIKV